MNIADRIGHIAKLFVMTMTIVGFAISISAADLKPVINKGKGDSCVADKDFMRLRHDRDKTMRQGDRNIKYSLKKCIECHATDAPDGTTLTVENPEHFCRSCHDYAAVSIDCFQCHASRPELDMSNKKNAIHKLPDAVKSLKGKK